MKYGNFQDPIGLVGRMLKSGNPSAYSSLFREGLSILSGPIDRMLQKKENYILQQSTAPSSLPLILIVGPPRGGTTLVYQVLASALPVSYLNNFSSLLPHSPIAATQLFERFSTSRKTSTFNNYYGNTRALADPNDGFYLWNRWLGSNRYEPNQVLTLTEKQEMQVFFNAWLTMFDKPFLNKNNRNLSCMDLLFKSLENVYFVVVQRNPVYIAQSLFIARQKIQGDQEIGWGLGADQLSHHTGRDTALKSVAEQVALIHKTLNEQRCKIPHDRIIDVDYEQFCHNPNQLIQRIYKKIWGNPAELSISLPTIKPFDISGDVRLSQDSFEKLKKFVDIYHEQYCDGLVP